MTRTVTILIGIMAVLAVGMPNVANAATEQAKQAAIDKGLAWLGSTQQADGRWTDANSYGALAATASAALAFIEEGYLPGADVIIDTGGGPVNYGDVVGDAATYVFNRANTVNMTAQTMGHPEDYDNNGTGDGNGIGIYFYPGSSNANVYTTGIVVPMIAALGNALTPDTVVGMGNANVNTKTYRQVMRDVVDWYSWGQVDPAYGNYRGGWRYNANYTSSDNSTAQWGGLTMLYGQDWGQDTPQFVKTELNRWVNYIQHGQDATWKAGGSGYDHPNTYVNMAKTGGLLLELAAMGVNVSDTRVQNAIGYMQSMILFDHWKQGATSFPDQWNGGHLNNPYAMWAVYKALSVYGINTISTAPGGFTIGQDWDPQTSAPGDWFAHYCDYLVGLQNAGGNWNGYSPWTGALAAGWYINILNAAGVPEPVVVIPEPLTMLCVFGGVAGLAGYLRKRTRA